MGCRSTLLGSILKMKTQISPVIIEGDGQTFEVTNYVLRSEVSLTVDSISQVTFTIADPGLRMLEKNIFSIRRTVYWVLEKFEISALEIRFDNVETVVIECRLARSQALKREKIKGLFSGGNATAFAAAQAQKAGLRFFGEDSPPKQAISQGGNDAQAQSTWEVMRSLAGQDNYLVFETGGRLFYTSQQFLLGKYAIDNDSLFGYEPGFRAIPIKWNSDPYQIITYTPIPSPAGRPFLEGFSRLYPAHVAYLQKVLRERAGQRITDPDSVYGFSTAIAVDAVQRFFGIPARGYEVDFHTWKLIDFLADLPGRAEGKYGIRALDLPGCRRSEDAPLAVSIDLSLPMSEGIRVRPGMTIRLDDIPYFAGFYLVKEVRFEAGTDNPVSVNATSPDVPQGLESNRFFELQAKIDFSGGGFATIEA